MEYVIRLLEKDEYSVIDDFLYQAIFIPEGVEPPPREIIYRPELRVYTENFGKRKGDYALCAEICDEICGTKRMIVGAVWTRIMNDYGHIDDQTPSFAIALYKEYRGMGIGTALMREMLEVLRQEGYAQASLAVQKQNRAVGLYEKTGFVTVSENDEEYIMLRKL